MSDFQEILNSFDPVTLQEMDAVKLLDRKDRKYIFHLERLDEILLQLSEEYRVLFIDGSRLSPYRTVYFDTPDMLMYRMHHNGKLNRHKIRFREYLNSGLRYFEIKFKSNKGRTIKDRVRIKNGAYSITGESADLLINKTIFRADMLREVLLVNYNRITLVKKNFGERITIDMDLKYNLGNREATFAKLVIAEIKQGRSVRSPFVTLMQESHIHPVSLSKYCLGVANLHPGVKINNFKPKILHVRKLCQNPA